MKIVENQKCTQWPHNDLNHLSVKSTLYTLNAYPRGTNFTPFRSTTIRFRDTGFSEIRNAPTKWPQNDLKHFKSVKSTLCTLNTHPEGQISLCFALPPAIFEIQVFQKSEMHLKVHVKSTLCTLNIHPRGPNFYQLKGTTLAVCEWQISICFAIQWAVFDLEVILRKCTEWP